jgi:hypothetical protein
MVAALLFWAGLARLVLSLTSPVGPIPVGECREELDDDWVVRTYCNTDS